MDLKEFDASVHPTYEQLAEEILCNYHRTEQRVYLFASALQGERVNLATRQVVRYFQEKIPSKAIAVSEEDIAEHQVNPETDFPEEEFIKDLKDKYSLILIPASGVLKDQRLIPYVSICDSAVVFVQAGTTERATVNNLLEILVRYDVNILGCILTGTLNKKLNRWTNKIFGWVRRLFR